MPIFHRAKVYTAYEYLENRFDAKTRALASLIFLMQRGLSVGLTFYAPAIVLSVIFGWPDRLTTLIIGVTVVVYTVTGGIRTVTWTDVQQMMIIMFGLVVALVMIIAAAAAAGVIPGCRPSGGRGRQAQRRQRSISIGTIAITCGVA